MVREFHIIIADDDDFVRLLMSSLVRRMNRRVSISIAGDGQAALETYAQCGADLVITDYDMPILDGITLAEQLRSRQPDLPILMLSGDSSLEPRARAAGVSYFLPKPSGFGQVKSILAGLLPPL
jgi:CheY-like chemotaxis protein